MVRKCVKSKEIVFLIVDDHMSIDESLCKHFEQEKIIVKKVESGEDALTAYACMTPDFILLSIMSSEMDGYDTCREIRKLPGGDLTPIMMVVETNDSSSIDHAYQAGATDFISQPINPNLLQYRLRYLLRASQAMIELRKSEARLAKAQRIASLGHWEWNLENNNFCVSEETCRILGLLPIDFKETQEAYFNLVHPDDKQKVKIIIDQSIKEKKLLNVEHRIISQDGIEQIVHQQAEILYDPHGQAIKMIGTIQEITERKRSEEQIRYLAYYDNLTDLPNRSYFNEHLSHAINFTIRHERIMAILFLDLDNFKKINDSLGHSAGDDLLKKISNRLKQCVRIEDVVARSGSDEVYDTVSRLGGDEFILMLTEIKQIQDAAKVAQRILESLSAPFNLLDRQTYISASIGISIAPHDGSEVDTLLKNADTAMYHAKNQGGNNYQFYTKSMNAISFERLTLENSLRKALERNELILYYQPQLNIHTRQLTGMEALARWHHPEFGLVSPAQFIPLAEETGLIIPIGEWVLRTACAQNKSLQERGFHPLKVAVNLSLRQLEEPSFFDTLSRAIKDTGLETSYLELELSESTTMQNVDRTVKTLQSIKEIGVGLSMDDFGTGYSSLSSLKRFPLNNLKIDRNFVRNITTDPDQAEIIKTIVAMANSLNFKVVAEGIETEEQMNFLRDLGCDEVQGFLFSPPVPIEELALFLQQENPFSPAVEIK